MKDCPECWYEVEDTTLCECQYCGCDFTKLIAAEFNDHDWIQDEQG